MRFYFEKAALIWLAAWSEMMDDWQAPQDRFLPERTEEEAVRRLKRDKKVRGHRAAVTQTRSRWAQVFYGLRSGSKTGFSFSFRLFHVNLWWSFSLSTFRKHLILKRNVSQKQLLWNNSRFPPILNLPVTFDPVFRSEENPCPGLKDTPVLSCPYKSRCLQFGPHTGLCHMWTMFWFWLTCVTWTEMYSHLVLLSLPLRRASWPLIPCGSQVTVWPWTFSSAWAVVVSKPKLKAARRKKSETSCLFTHLCSFIHVFTSGFQGDGLRELSSSCFVFCSNSNDNKQRIKLQTWNMKTCWYVVDGVTSQVWQVNSTGCEQLKEVCRNCSGSNFRLLHKTPVKWPLKPACQSPPSGCSWITDGASSH